jgi:hypothetical protein
MGGSLLFLFLFTGQRRRKNTTREKTTHITQKEGLEKRAFHGLKEFHIFLKTSWWVGVCCFFLFLLHKGGEKNNMR